MAILPFAVLATISALGCRQHGERERLFQQQIQQQRARLHELMNEQQAIEAKFQALGPGTPESEVVRQFGKPARLLPCSNADECWYYDISGQKYFICFDKQSSVTCHGRAAVLQYRQYRVVAPN